MRICRVELRNFRGIRYGCVDVPKHAVLLGANNAGKSTIVEALALLFGRERMIRPISDWDFYGGAPRPDTRFYVIATVTDFPDNDPVNVPEWFIGEKAARPIWWDDRTSTVSTQTDPPAGALLAAQLAMVGRYDDETCDFETIRYFYDGDSDPFTDGSVPVPVRVLRDVGVFLLSGNREWDRLLSFSSSSLLKVIREYDALPGKAVEELKMDLRDKVTKVEEVAPLSDVLDAAIRELQSFLLVGQSSKMVYRPTSLDAFSVLQSLVAHVAKPDGSLIPVSRHGAGMISLQAFLLLLAFAEQRRTAGQNFILLAEEPELHLHPSLHQRLVLRIRSASVQSIVTTQSPSVASGYQPDEVIFVQNNGGQMNATRLRTEPVKQIKNNSVRNLYLVHRSAFYEALMGGVILVPEGMYDFEWLSLWQRLAQSSPDAAAQFDLRPITVVPTSDAGIVETLQETFGFRQDAIPVIDGDSTGAGYLGRLTLLTPAPAKVVRYGDNAAVECLAAWILEPALGKPGNVLTELLRDSGGRELKDLQDALIAKKKDRELRENLVWESLGSDECCMRACEFFHDLAAIAFDGSLRNPNWKIEVLANGCRVFTAAHIRRV